MPQQTKRLGDGLLEAAATISIASVLVAWLKPKEDDREGKQTGLQFVGNLIHQLVTNSAQLIVAGFEFNAPQAFAITQIPNAVIYSAKQFYEKGMSWSVLMKIQPDIYANIFKGGIGIVGGIATNTILSMGANVITWPSPDTLEYTATTICIEAAIVWGMTKYYDCRRIRATREKTAITRTIEEI